MQPMVSPPQEPSADRRPETPDGAPILAEDLLLLLFQPNSGTIAGENTLFYVLAGAVLADLALHECVTTTTTRVGTVKVEAAAGRAPTDRILRSAWDRLSEKPLGVQTILAAIGPALREPLLARLLARGDLREERRKVLGLFNTTALRDGGSARRSALLHDVRDALVNGAEPMPRTAALTALIWGSGTLPQFDPEIPWTSPVIARAREFEQGNWGAAAAGEAVTRTMTAVIVNSAIVAITMPPQN